MHFLSLVLFAVPLFLFLVLLSTEIPAQRIRLVMHSLTKMPSIEKHSSGKKKPTHVEYTHERKSISRGEKNEYKMLQRKEIYSADAFNNKKRNLISSITTRKKISTEYKKNYNWRLNIAIFDCNENRFLFSSSMCIIIICIRIFPRAEQEKRLTWNQGKLQFQTNCTQCTLYKIKKHIKQIGEEKKNNDDENEKKRVKELKWV